MRTEAHATTDGTIEVRIKTYDGMESGLAMVATLSLTDATLLAEQIREAVAAFPPSAQDSSAWVEANR